MTIQEISGYINEGKLPLVSKRFEIKSIINKYPYFQEGIFIYLKILYLAKDKTFRSELQRFSIFVSDKKALFYYVLSNEYQKFFEQKGNQKEINKSRTDILLNAFFETVDDSAIDLQIESSIIGPGMVHSDYFSFIEDKREVSAEKENCKPMKYQNIIDNFINNAEENYNIKFSSRDNAKIADTPAPKEKSEEELSEELQDDFFFTETLANIYIKQQKYERAYEIIKRLNLNYPEKNIYFANQISFLEKLIINKQHKR